MIVVIVGFGSAGKYYLDILKKDKNIKKIFIIEKKKISLNNFFEQTNLKKIVKNNIKIDHAIICTPSGYHYDLAKFFIKRKVNVLIEKPFVLKLSHATELIKLSKKNKIKCWVVFQNRYNLAISKLKKLIEGNTLGEISLVDTVMLWHRSYAYYKVNWRGKYKTDGGVLANQAIHLLDALVYLFGEIKNFNALAGFNKKKLQAEDIIDLSFIHKNNILSSLKATTRANRDYRSAIDVIGEKGRVIVKGISLNTFNYFKKDRLIMDKVNSEEFTLGLGPISGMGNGHFKILKEFLNKKIKLSSKNLEINNNYYLLKLIHSIYIAINNKNKNKNIIKNKQSIWGK
jgi:UDP-N-acetyl-2-amino-2-deoxyglucuronate dehydrogenase